ncbi:unnamed protein product, partial [Closterium sp. NIES-65]
MASPCDVSDADWVINLWSGPRSLSTSLMYSFAQARLIRPDTVVVDEPLYADFLTVTGAPRPYRQLVLDSMDSNGKRVVDEVVYGPQRSKPLRFVKHMAKQCREELQASLLSRGRHVILIRDPMLLIPSFGEVSPPSLSETALPHLLAIHSALSHMDRPPPVVDATRLQSNPQGVLRALCQALDIPFYPEMLSWPAGKRPEDRVWAPWWYTTTHATVTLLGGRAMHFPLSLCCLPQLACRQAPRGWGVGALVVYHHSCHRHTTWWQSNALPSLSVLPSSAGLQASAQRMGCGRLGGIPPLMPPSHYLVAEQCTSLSLCAAFLSWPAGKRPEDGVWAPWWYTTTHATVTLLGGRAMHFPLSLCCLPQLACRQAPRGWGVGALVVYHHSCHRHTTWWQSNALPSLSVLPSSAGLQASAQRMGCGRLGGIPPLMPPSHYLVAEQCTSLSLCAAFLSWPAGKRPEDGVWAPWWYTTTHATVTLLGGRAMHFPLSLCCLPQLACRQAPRGWGVGALVVYHHSCHRHTTWWQSNALPSLSVLPSSAGLQASAQRMGCGRLGGIPPLMPPSHYLVAEQCTSLSLCAAFLSWPAGKRPEDGVWAPWWYTTTHATVTLLGGRAMHFPLSLCCLPQLACRQAPRGWGVGALVVYHHSCHRHTTWWQSNALPSLSVLPSSAGLQASAQRMGCGRLGGIPPLMPPSHYLVAEQCTSLSLCAAFLSWPAGKRPEDGVWAPWWYTTTHATVTLLGGRAMHFPLSLCCLPQLACRQAPRGWGVGALVVYHHSCHRHTTWWQSNALPSLSVLPSSAGLQASAQRMGCGRLGGIPPLMPPSHYLVAEQCTSLSLCAAFLSWPAGKRPEDGVWAPCWPAGKRPEDGVWAPWWYTTTHASTGFAPPALYPKPKMPTPHCTHSYHSVPTSVCVPALCPLPTPSSQPFPMAHYSLLEDCRPFYSLLLSKALVPLTTTANSSTTTPTTISSSISASPLPSPPLPVPANEKLLVWVGEEGLVTRRDAKQLLVWVGEEGLVPRRDAKVDSLHRLSPRRLSLCRPTRGCWCGWVGEEGLVDVKIHVLDSAVQGGDAVWEGLRVYDGRIFKLQEHLDRLFDSSKAMAFANVPTREHVVHALVSTLAANGMRDYAHVRLTLTRGKKVTSGMSPQFNLYGCTLIVLAEWKPPVYDNARGIKLVTASTRRNSPQCVDSHIHHNNLINNILAKIEGNNAGADDAVMLDVHGYVSETNATNIFMVKRGRILTPHADSCLPGITRATVIELARQEGIPIQECNITTAQLHAADE